jgi:hypothetical protein
MEKIKPAKKTPTDGEAQKPGLTKPVKPKKEPIPTEPLKQDQTSEADTEPEPFTLTPPESKNQGQEKKEPTVRLNVEIPESYQDRLKIHAIKTKRTVKEIIQTLIDDNIPPYDG